MAFINKLFSGDEAAFRRATYKGSGDDPKDLTRPHIGIANTYGSLIRCSTVSPKMFNDAKMGLAFK